MVKKYKLILFIILLVSFVLRFYKLNDNPPGLYIDEVAIGQNAYEILKTGKDEHGYVMPLFFKSFGDYKMPVYIYSTSLSMSIFGKNEFAVRFPSALFGVLTVLLIYLIVKKILLLDDEFSKDRIEKIALLSAFLMGISSWHIHFSRGGFETNQALFLFLLAVFLSISYFKNKKIIYLVFSTLLFTLSIYTYHSYRIISPLFFLGLVFIFLYKDKLRRKNLAASLILFSILFLPILIFSFSGEGSARFSATSVFSELGELSAPQKVVQYPFAVIKNYLSYFSFYYIFATGDGIGRHQIPEFGLLFRWQLPFLLIGLYSLLRSNNNILKLLVISLIIIAPIPASLAVPSPHSLRSLLMVFPMTILVAVGLVYFFDNLKRFKIYLVPVLMIVSIFEFIFYSHYYYVHYPQVNPKDWGAGYKEIVVNTERLRNAYDHVIIDKNYLNFAPIYFKFYSTNKVPEMVDASWSKPKGWGDEKVLYIRPFYGPTSSPDMIFEVFLDKKNNKDVISQFWKL